MVAKSTPHPTDTKIAIMAALLGIVDDFGLDQVSIREVATRAGVSVGTVQHHYSTKDAMLAAAYREVVQGIRKRLQDFHFGHNIRENLFVVLCELLPLDARRASEVRVHVAFAARAATTTSLASIERDILDDVHRELAAAIMAASWSGEHSADDCLTLARIVLALADGLALHAISSNDLLSQEDQTRTMSLALDALLR